MPEGDDRLTSTIRLRECGRHQEALRALLDIQTRTPSDPVLNYHCAWTLDLLGREREAIAFYERAIENGCEADDLRGALLGLGSTYRCVGEYDKAVETLERGRRLFPLHRGFDAFLAMARFNRGESAEAVRLLLIALAETSGNSDVQAYRRALLDYADKLDQVW